MNIYFSCSVIGGRQDEKIYQELVGHLIKKGHDVPTVELIEPNVLELEEGLTDQEIFERDVRWVDQCDALIAEVSTASHGVGYEIALALTLNKPVYCIYLQDRKVSKMLLGNTFENFQISKYTTIKEAKGYIDKFLQKLGAVN
ncbi:MAG: nucleoside 2-deoxyribosyltransferase [Anaerolineaceae bacterium]|nr:nucleoside 2-deoxyribosyltransferase [Anaerolineaceae bacterium]